MSDNIAHDLRSPVTRIRGEAEIALTARTSIDEYQNMASGTVEECDRLLDMINTMLMISKTESGVQEINKSNIDIVKTLKSACNLFQPMAENKGLKLIFNNSDNIMLNGDTRKIQRMIANLLDNAIKYSTSEGNICLSAFLDNEKSVVISVKDMGIGIEDKDIPHIFNRFYRCDPSRPQGGAGLGLSLAKAIVEAHDGKITVKSVKNAGSIFIVTIPNKGSSNASASSA
jgi:signal transduction histidine kinase